VTGSPRGPRSGSPTALRAALFDWDGTLSDSREALLASWYESTEAVLGRRFPADAAEEDLVFTQPGSRIWPSIAGDAGIADQLAHAFQAAYERCSSTVRAFPGVIELLAGLRASGIGTGVVTSKGRERYEPDARRIGVADEIEVAVCAGEAPPKPDPGGVLEALRRLSVKPEHAAMVGDTVVDIAAGLQAGVHPIGVTWGHGRGAELIEAGAGAIAETPAELGQILTRPLSYRGASECLTSSCSRSTAWRSRRVAQPRLWRPSSASRKQPSSRRLRRRPRTAG
jgi:HAD superfamily hydrolase (TIGR01509 family)